MTKNMIPGDVVRIEGFRGFCGICNKPIILKALDAQFLGAYQDVWGSYKNYQLNHSSKCVECGAVIDVISIRDQFLDASKHPLFAKCKGVNRG